ncbi:M55 family metallopeptidase [Fictibacillus fluitans]|uniref:M55 family metallopeptidase n=1 Tax=Fictibacillus fluitans TaxID=3058422 RepID=A0ABT8HTC6_9BACL|nr:M55 family metallopeptidase [Fictibacillus sp. NE201]MDN4524032.1 M55 family metallopeptidase [Fictibacillus sp. NE201]
MKVFISADMEGISGITDIEDILPNGRTYEYCRKLFTKDVNAAIEGALEGGATQIVVNESHGPMRNLLPEELHPKAEVVRGFYKPLLMMEGLDDSFDAVFFVGYHGKAGEKDAILNHTFLGSSIQRLYLNGREVSEGDYNAAVAGELNVPVVLLTGDSQTCADARRNFPGIITTEVKRGIGAFTAQCLHPKIARELIKSDARKAVENCKAVKPVEKQSSYTIDIEFKHTNMASIASYIPQVEWVDPRTVRYITDDLIKGTRVLLALMLLSIQASGTMRF